MTSTDATWGYAFGADGTVGSAEAMHVLGLKDKKSLRRRVDRGLLRGEFRMPGESRSGWIFDRRSLTQLAAKTGRIDTRIPPPSSHE